MCLNCWILCINKYLKRVIISTYNSIVVSRYWNTFNENVGTGGILNATLTAWKTKRLRIQSMDLLVKVVFEDSFPVEVSATAATEMLYWYPGIKWLMVKEVALVKASPSPGVHWTLYDVALPTGSVQARDTDVVVMLVILRLLTTSGSANTRKTQDQGIKISMLVTTLAFSRVLTFMTVHDLINFLIRRMLNIWSGAYLWLSWMCKDLLLYHLHWQQRLWCCI